VTCRKKFNIHSPSLTIGTLKEKGGEKMGEKLAILGGKKTVTIREPSWPIVDIEMVYEIVRVLSQKDSEKIGLNLLSPLVTKGNIIGEVEEAWANYQNRKYAIATNSGTAALHAAVSACGVGPGDEVIVSPYTWGTTVGVILLNFAIPVFADIDPRTYNLDPEKVAEKITPQTKAIMVVHIYGHPCDMDPIMKVAKENDLKVIEDCAQAHGATYKSKKVGSLGHIAGFSFQGSKNVPGGEGGILVTDDEELYERALIIGQHPARILADVKNKELLKYNFATSWSYRMHPLAAALTLVGLRHLDERNKIRAENFEYLSAGLEEIAGVDPVYVAPNCFHSYHMYSPTYLVEEDVLSREKFIEALRAEGVPITTYVKVPIHLSPTFLENYWLPFGKGFPWSCPLVKRKVTYRRGDCPVAEERSEKRELKIAGSPYCVPCKDLIDQYLEAFRKVAKEYKLM